MRDFIQRMRCLWRLMLASPWKPNPLYATRLRWELWATSWFFVLLGMFSGALVAPAILAWAGFQSASPYYDWLLIAIAIVIGVGWQFVSHASMAFGLALMPDSISALPFRKRFVRLIPGLIYIVISFIITVWLLNVYDDLIKSEGSEINIAFLGGLIIKIVVFPAIKFLVGTVILKRVISWIRDDDNRATPRS